MTQTAAAAAAAAVPTPLRQLNGVGFSLTGSVGKRERARIESTIEDYIRQNYQNIRSQLTGTASSIRLCINRSTNEITIVTAPSNPTDASACGSSVGPKASNTCIRRARRTASSVQQNCLSRTDSSMEKMADSGTMLTKEAADKYAAADAIAGAAGATEDNGMGNGESMDAAIEYLMSRDRRSSSLATAGAQAKAANIKQRMLKSTIPMLRTTNNVTVGLLPHRPAHITQLSHLRQLSAPGAAEAVAIAKCPTDIDVDRLVGVEYDVEARGSAFRSLFPTVRGEFFIYYDHGETHCRKMLLAMGFVEKLESEERDQFRNSDQMSLMWCNGAIAATKRKTGLGFHIINRLRFRGLITNKCSLVRTLAEFELSHPSLVPKGLEAATFLPATVHLNAAGAIDVLHKIRQRGLYLIKPGYSDCGKGIVLYRSDGTMDSLINSLSTNYPDYAHKDLVLQKYIENPLLLNGKKFDLRVYLLLVPNQRREVGVYAFVHPGYARLACRDFNIHSDDLTLHLTNQAVQHRDKTYKAVKESTVWSPDVLNAYLNEHLTELRVPCVDWVRRRLYPRIRAILGHVTSLVSSSLCDEPFSYELFGCDFLIDSEFNVWLLELNSDPSLNKSTQVLRQIVTQAVEESVALAVEVLQRAARGLPVKGLATQQDFRKVFSHSNESVLRCIFSESRLQYPHFGLSQP